MPDYSICGDIPNIENKYRKFKGHLASLWLTFELKGIVIPLVCPASYHFFDIMLCGFQESKTVAFNLKGPLGDSEQLPIFKDAIKYTVDNMKKLRSIIVYSASPDIDKILSIFSYALEHNIRIQIPGNMLMDRNAILQKGGANVLNK